MILIVFLLLWARVVSGDVVIGNHTPTPGGVANGPIAGLVSFRFTATQSGCVKKFLMFWRYNSPDKLHSGGYSKGDGGFYKIDIRGDAENGVPEKTTLDTAYFRPSVEEFPNTDSRNAFRSVEFSGKACLQVGLRYHVVLENIHSFPKSNYISFNGPYLEDTKQNFIEASPCDGNCETPTVLHNRQELWLPYREDAIPNFVYFPFWCVTMDNKIQMGQDILYGHLHSEQVRVSGIFRVRQTFILKETVEGDLTLNTYLKKKSGYAPLNVLINGKLVGKVTTAQSYSEKDYRLPGELFDWHSVRATGKFEAGKIHTIEFFTNHNTEYEIGTGASAKIYCDVSLHDGRAEYSVNNGDTWTGYTLFSYKDHPSVQLNTYLRFD